MPACSHVLKVFERLDRTSGFVFPSFNGNQLHRQYLSRRFKHFVRKAGLDERFNFHSLRHTAITWLISNGASLEAARIYAGHSSVRVTEVYGHLPEKEYGNQIELAFARSGGFTYDWSSQ